MSVALLGFKKEINFFCFEVTCCSGLSPTIFYLVKQNSWHFKIIIWMLSTTTLAETTYNNNDFVPPSWYTQSLSRHVTKPCTLDLKPMRVIWWGPTIKLLNYRFYSKLPPFCYLKVVLLWKEYKSSSSTNSAISSHIVWQNNW